MEKQLESCQEYIRKIAIPNDRRSNMYYAVAFGFCCYLIYLALNYIQFEFISPRNLDEPIKTSEGFEWDALYGIRISNLFLLLYPLSFYLLLKNFFKDLSWRNLFFYFINLFYYLKSIYTDFVALFDIAKLRRKRINSENVRICKKT